MKTLHFASILVLAAAATFACEGDDDLLPLDGRAGSGGEAGKSSNAGSNAAAGKNATAGSTTGGNGSSGSAGAAGSDGGGAGAGHDGGTAGGGGAAGANEGGGGAHIDFPGGAGAGGELSATGGSGGEGGAGNGAAALEIIGEWDNGFGTDVISQTAWTSFTVDSIVEYDNEANTLYIQVAADAQYNPNKFSKVVYTDVENDSFWCCTIEFAKGTLQDAKAGTNAANSSDPANGGCGPFPWSQLTRE